MNVTKDCPFCGKHMDPNDVDTLYPAGIGWKEDDGFRHYVSIYDVPREQWCYVIVCQTHYGGCGAEMIGDSIEETLEKWNKRV
jgi:hypothetical protein